MTTPSNDNLHTMYRALFLEFLAELLNATSTTDTTEAFQRVVQTFCDDLRPWLTPTDVPPEPRAVFSLLDECCIDDITDVTTVQLSPEGEAFFRAWVRRQAVLMDTRRYGNPERSH